MTDPCLRFRLDGRVAVITGASSGIGAELARGFARAGAAVALLARRIERLETLAAALRAEGATVCSLALDVNQPDGITTAFERITETLGIPEVIVNNAGIAEPSLFLKTTARSRDATMATNFNAAWDISAEAARRLIAAKRPGCILNVASVLALGVGPGYAAYAASKAALVQMTRSLALEFVRHRIRVNALAPGWFVTEMNQEFFATEAGQDYLRRIPPARAGQLEELVGPALLLASDAGSFVNGVTLPVDGGHHVALV